LARKYKHRNGNVLVDLCNDSSRDVELLLSRGRSCDQKIAWRYSAPLSVRHTSALSITRNIEAFDERTLARCLPPPSAGRDASGESEIVSTIYYGSRRNVRPRQLREKLRSFSFSTYTFICAAKLIRRIVWMKFSLGRKLSDTIQSNIH